MLYDNSHSPTLELSKRIKDLAFAGLPLHIIAKVVKLDDDTVKKYYSYELQCAEPEAIAAVAKVVKIQAEGGCTKSQALYLKTKGAKYGWVEKQIIETISSDEMQVLKDKAAEFENKHDKEY